MRGNYYRIFRPLRTEDLVHWTVEWLDRGFSSITRSDDVRAIFSDAEAFCSRLGAFVRSPEVDTIPPEQRGRDAMSEVPI